MVKHHLIVITIIAALLNCSDRPEIAVDPLGVSELYIVNDSYDSIVAVTTVSITDSIVRVGCRDGDTAFLCEDWGIGGWLRPSEIIKEGRITVYDTDGNAVVEIVDSLGNNADWICAKGSSWERSMWYLHL